MLSPQGRAAEHALTALESAVMSARRHGAAHRTAQKAGDAAQAALDAYTAEFQALSVSVRAHGLVVADEVVLGREETPCELMRLLLPDGIGALSFDPPFPRQALDALVALFAEHWRGDAGLQPAGDGRLLTALWGLGLTQLSYRIYDPLAPNATRVFQRKAALGTGVLDHTPLLAPVAGRMGDLVETIMLAEEDRPSSERFFRRLQRVAPRSKDPRDWAGLPERARAYLESDPGRPRRKLLERLPSDEADDRNRALDVLEWSTRQTEDAPAPVVVGRFLAAVAARCLAEGDLDGAASTLSRARDLDQPQEVRRVITLRLGSRGALELAARALRAQDGLEPEDLINLGLSYFRHLDDQAVEPTCRLYPSLANSDVRRVFRRFLTSRVETHAEQIATLAEAAEETIVTEAVGILALGKKGSRARELLEQAAQDELEPRRTLALEALDVVTGERKRREMGRLLGESGDRHERLSAIGSLKSDGSSRAFEELVEVVSKPDFAQRDEEEQHLAFDALTELGGLRAVRVLQEIANRKSGLFGRKQSEQLKRIAHAWLQRLKGRRGR
jgi:hypothetical protein